MKKIAFQSDRFKKNRGGRSRWLMLSCEKCEQPLFAYQKDGPGILKRLYIDRIISVQPVSEKQNLACKKCKTVLGVPIIYQKENRPALRLFAGAVTKKIATQKEVEAL